MAKSPTVRTPAHDTPAEIKAAIRERAIGLGFATIGFTTAAPATDHRRALPDRLATFVADGLHGDMGWMAANMDRRGDPQVLWPEAQTAVVLGMNYRPDTDPLETLAQRDRAAISVYAQGRDYHDVVKSRLKQLGRWIGERYGCALKVFVDTAPVMEKPLAHSSGIGWQGKHTNLVSRELGSWLFLGEILLPLDLPPDPPEADHCGSCRACLDICPTAAFPAPYRLDPRRCISYLTIEHKGPIAREFRRAMGNRIYGCDDCLAVCPWNKFARQARDGALEPRAALGAPRLVELATLDDAAFRQMFAGTAIKRSGRERFIRNVAIALGNSGRPDIALPPIEGLMRDESPLVRGAAVWAFAQLADPEQIATACVRHLRDETDPDVREEWLSASGGESRGPRTNMLQPPPQDRSRD